MASSSPTLSRTVENRGINCGLPTYSPQIRDLKAIVFGANGISGNYMLRVLSQAPERWGEIVALSRRPPVPSLSIGRNVRHVRADLLQDPKDIAKILRENQIQADVVFFFAYIQPAPKEGAGLWSNAEEMARVNGKLLQNCLDALEIASVKPKRFLLQTGAKHYGGHLGPVDHPAPESSPRILLEPNFYYVQEDILFEYCRRNGVQWNVVRPAFILGAVEDAAMNVVYPLAVYAAVQKHKGEKLVWPGDAAAWEKEVVQSSAMLNSYLSEFVVLNDQAGNEAFNAADSCPFTYGKLWAELAEWHGMDFTFPEEDNSGFQQLTMHYKPPRGFGPPPTLRFKYTFVEWAQRPENQQAWKQLVQKHDLKGPAFDPDQVPRIFEFLDFAALAPYPFSLSVTKARKLGWNGYVDSIESHHQVINELAAMKMVPALI